MTTTGSFVLQRLVSRGVDRVYGYPGDGINGILGGFHELREEIEFLQVRHEEIAAFAATADAKLTGEVGVCLATSGPGAIHLLNGLYDAKLDHTPVVAIFVVCVLNNGDLNQVTWEQRVMSGDPKLEASQVLPAFDYARYAELIGLERIRVRRPEDLGPAWDRALSAGRPVVLDVVCDPEVPPLPPHIRLEQGRAMASALRKGDPAAREIIRHSLRGKLAELMAGHGR